MNSIFLRNFIIILSLTVVFSYISLIQWVVYSPLESSFSGKYVSYSSASNHPFLFNNVDFNKASRSGELQVSLVHELFYIDMFSISPKFRNNLTKVIIPLYWLIYALVLTLIIWCIQKIYQGKYSKSK